MKTTIFCKSNGDGIHSFYLVTKNDEYFLFNQNYRKGVQQYFGQGVLLHEATDYSKAHRDEALAKTMTKLPMYIRYIEKEHGIEILEKTKRKNDKGYRGYHMKDIRCA